MQRKHVLAVVGMIAAAIILVLLLRKPSAGPVRDGASSSPAPVDTLPAPVLVGPAGTALPYVPQGDPGPNSSGRVDPTKQSEHATGIDRSRAQLLAMMKAEGKTPCDTAYNATQAEQEKAKEIGKTSIFVRVASRADFMRMCEGLSEAAQQCMAPRYLAKNREACLPLKPPPDVLKQMFEMRKDLTAQFDEDPENQPGFGDAGRPAAAAPGDQ